MTKGSLCLLGYLLSLQQIYKYMYLYEMTHSMTTLTAGIVVSAEKCL